jgi:hypothetical protein
MKKFSLTLIVTLVFAFNANAAKMIVENTSDYTVDVRVSSSWGLSFKKHNVLASGETRIIEIDDEKPTSLKMYRCNAVAAAQNVAAIGTRALTAEGIDMSNAVGWVYAAGSFAYGAYKNAPFVFVKVDPQAYEDTKIAHVVISNYADCETTIDAKVNFVDYTSDDAEFDEEKLAAEVDDFVVIDGKTESVKDEDEIL